MVPPPLLLLLLLQGSVLLVGGAGAGEAEGDSLPPCRDGEDGAPGRCLSSDAPARSVAEEGDDGASQPQGAEPAAVAPEVGILSAATDLAVPNITNGDFVVDHAQLFTEEERSQLKSLLLDAKKNSTILPLVVTVAFIPQPVVGQHLHRAQLVRQFGTAVSRHFFQTSTSWQLKTLIVIVQKGMAAAAGNQPQFAPRIDVFTGKKMKQKVKDSRIRQILRHPNITRAMEHTDEVSGKLAPRYFDATRLVVDRTTLAARQSGGLFGGSSGFTGLLPIMVGGFAFFYFQKTKFGGNRSSDFDNAQMDRDFQKMMASDPQLASMMGAAGGMGRMGGMGGMDSMSGMGGGRGMGRMGRMGGMSRTMGGMDGMGGSRGMGGMDGRSRVGGMHGGRGMYAGQQGGGLDAYGRQDDY